MPYAPLLSARRLRAFFLAAVLGLGSAAAQGGIDFGSQLQGLGSSPIGLGSLGGDALRVPGLGIPGASMPSTWSTPGLHDSRPLFEPIDEDAYIVGPGDRFHVSTAVRFFSVVVGPEGDVVLEGVAPVQVTGLSLRAARALLIDKLSPHYRRDAIQVRLSEAKRFQVLIAGSVNRPGLHILDYGSRVSHALDAAGGYSARAARRITLQRASGDTLHVDLRDFFIQGDLLGNPLLRQGDRILAPALNAAEDVVFVREGAHVLHVTYVQDETLEEFVLRYDNFRDGRIWESVRLYDSTGRFLTEVFRDQAASLRLTPGTTVEIQHTKNTVFIGGMVLRPGPLPYNPTMTAMDYLAQAGITVGTSDVRRLDILGSDGRKRHVDVARDPLRPGDHILVPRSIEATLRDHIALVSAISSLAVAIATFVVLTGE